MLDSPSGPMIVVDRMAHRTLMGFGARQPETMLRAVEEVTPGQVAASLGEMLPTAIVALPHPVGPVEGRMARLPVSSPSEVTGEQVSSNVSGRRLTVGDDGVTVSAADSDFRVTVRYSECEAVLSWSDGKRTLIGADGFFVVIDPAEWPGGERITEQVLSRIPDLVRVAMDGPGPEMPRPPSPSPATPPPKSSSRASGSSTKLGDLAIRWGWIAVLALGWLGVVAGHGMTQIGGLILIVLAVATRLVYVQRLRRRSRRPRQRKPETGV